MSRPLEVAGVEHTGMIVRDTQGLADWYSRVLGASVVSRSDESPPIIFLSFGGASLLELIPAGGPDAPTVPSDHVHFCLAVENLEKAVADLAALEISLDRPVFLAYDGSPVAFFRDPEGNLLQLVQRVVPLVAFT